MVSRLRHLDVGRLVPGTYPTYFRNDGKNIPYILFVYVRQLPEREKAWRLTETEGGNSNTRYLESTLVSSML